MSVRLATSRDRDARAAAAATRSTGCCDRYPLSRACPFRLLSRDRAFLVVSGARSRAVSRKTSVKTPPMPTSTMGPNTGSRRAPKMSSTPGRAIFCTRYVWVVPTKRLWISRKDLAREEASHIFRVTPPWSVLCMTALEHTFRATGYPSSRAAVSTSASLSAIIPSMTGMPQSLISDDPSCSLSVVMHSMSRSPLSNSCIVSGERQGASGSVFPALSGTLCAVVGVRSPQLVGP